MSNIAIEFQNVGKQYRLGTVGTGTISHDLNRWWQTTVLRREDPYLKIGEVNDRAKKGSSEFVWALQDINFKVEQGDVVGIIGKNGAGKSTLLKLLSNITSPSTGMIKYEGRIATLLEVGTGFHPELTGRENIYMNGSIMGMTKHEITRKLDEIVAFAGVERYLDTPVKRYSSGMTVRLGFAVAAFLEPEILVVDEVLTVGDAEFQKKAIGKMKDVSSESGRTVLFVSHNMAAVKSLCTRGIVLKNGMLDYDGTTETAIEHYMMQTTDSDSKSIKDSVTSCEPYIKVHSIEINGTTENESIISYGQETFDVVFRGTATIPIHANLSVFIKNVNDTPLASLSECNYLGKHLDIPIGDFTIKKTIKMPKFYAAGDTIIELKLIDSSFHVLMHAPYASRIHLEGGYNEYCTATTVIRSGFLGLENIAE